MNSRIFSVLLVLLFAAGTSHAATPPVRIATYAGDRAAAISYTFDDGLRDQYTLAVPMLNEVGFNGTFFVIAGKTAETPAEGKQKDLDPNVRKQWGGISWPELREMSDQGHEIGSHTWSHRNMPKIPPADVEPEISKAYDEIKTRIGKPPLTLAFPFNQSTPEIQAIAAKYHVACRAFQLGTGGSSTAASLNAWADKQVKDRKWGILMTHAVTRGYAQMTGPEVLRDHLKYVKNHDRDIWVDTFANVSRYGKERDDARLTVTGRVGNVTCMLSSTLDPELYNVPLTIVIAAPGARSVQAKRGEQELPARVVNGSILVEAAPNPQPIVIAWK